MASVDFVEDKEDQEDRDCSICLCGDSNLKTKCNHWFHKDCLATWKKGKDRYSCPNCRYELIEVIEVVRSKEGIELFIPLMFWYRRDAPLAIPSVALSYPERFINIDFAPINDLVENMPPSSNNKQVAQYVDRPVPMDIDMDGGFNVIPSALYPSSFQPSGNVNLSDPRSSLNIPFALYPNSYQLSGNVNLSDPKSSFNIPFALYPYSFQPVGRVNLASPKPNYVCAETCDANGNMRKFYIKCEPKSLPNNTIKN